MNSDSSQLNQPITPQISEKMQNDGRHVEPFPAEQPRDGLIFHRHITEVILFLVKYQNSSILSIPVSLPFPPKDSLMPSSNRSAAGRLAWRKTGSCSV